MPVHNRNNQKVVNFLRQLSLQTDEIEAYLFLVQRGRQTVLSLSRGLKTGRTKLYPLLQTLSEKGLVEARVRHYGTAYEAVDPSALEFLVSEEESASYSLRSSLPEALNALNQISQTSPATSKIIEYTGLDGFKQMNWNLLEANQTVLIYELPGLDKRLGRHFQDKLEENLRAKDISRQIISNRKAAGKAAKDQNVTYLDPKIFTISSQTYIYNNVVGFMGLDEKVLKGVEIYDVILSAQQKQFFTFLQSRDW